MASRATRRGRNQGASDTASSAPTTTTTYQEIMGFSSATNGNDDADKSAIIGLSQRLKTFRSWLSDDAQVTVHPGICIVNGEATDGTRNAPVLVFDNASEQNQQQQQQSSGEPRLGAIDGEYHQNMFYERTMGCEIRTVKEIKAEEIVMSVPRGAMITPDLVAASDAGRAVRACGPQNSRNEFWETFSNTVECTQQWTHKIPRNNAPQILLKILQERKKAEAAFQKYSSSSTAPTKFTNAAVLSTRAPVLAFLIHQRFAASPRPRVSDNSSNKKLGSDPDIKLPPDCPETFGPYARTLPSSVSVPLCWKRNELALLTGCLPGLSLLQDVATQTFQLVNEFIALLHAGILTRFPDVFPPGLLTWERWVWAAAISASRRLPASLYVDDEVPIENVPPSLEFQSPADIWSELGVMVPLLDMLNHVVESNQVTWLAPSADPDRQTPKAVLHSKVRKGSEVFTSYGLYGNHELLAQYGFAMMNNASDEVKMGWALADGVGQCRPPVDYSLDYPLADDLVFESNDETLIKAWWTEERLKLLQKEVNLEGKGGETQVESLKSGKKLTTTAFNDGSYDPILLTAAVVATVPETWVKNNVRAAAVTNPANLVITPRHQTVLRRYLEFSFSRKLEKLLQNLENGLKAHYAGINLWTKACSGALDYQADHDGNDAKGCIGWQSFFDANAYNTAFEVEQQYYAMGVDSCVLTLYDGQLRALKSSIESISSDGHLSPQLQQQLQDLGFKLGTVDDDEGKMGKEEAEVGKEDSNESSNEGKKTASNGGVDNNKSPKTNKKRKKKGKNEKDSPAGKERPPAMKLHVGNLSYTTTPSDLYDYFCERYGEHNVLECHIPTERESGRSRGFGFVAMPESIAADILKKDQRHEVGGRAVKIAKSNSVGATNNGSIRAVELPPSTPATDRCSTCGYRPRYCSCANKQEDRGRDHRPNFGRPPDYGRLDWDRRGGYDGGPPPPDWHHRYHGDGYKRYGDYDRHHRHRHHHDRYGRGSDDRRMRRDDWSPRDRSRSRSRDSGRRRDDDDWSRSKRSRSRSRERSRKRRSRRRGRSRSTSPRSRSHSPPSSSRRSHSPPSSSR